MILTGSDIVVQSLIDEGVDIVFGYPGGQVINLYDSLYNCLLYTSDAADDQAPV